MRGVLFILLTSIWCHTAVAQKTFVYTDPNKLYQEGQELFAEKNYAGARERLERITPQPAQTTGTNSFITAEKVDYLIAVCAAETNDKDAETLLRSYFIKYHATEHRNAITFYLGKYYAQNNKYAEATEWLEKVDASELDASQIVEYKFLLAYSYFVKKKFDQAKPLFRDIKDVKEKYFYPSNYYYAFISFYQKDYRNALNSFKAIEDSKMYASVIPYYIAQIHFLQKNYKEAITYINNNIDKSAPSYKDEMYHLLGEAYFQTSDYAKALPHIEKFVAANNKVRKEDIYELGICQYKTGAYDAAIGNFEQINLLDEPMGQSATYALADCYLKTNAKSKARSAFQSAASKDFDKDIKQISLFQYGKLSYELGYASEAVSTMETYLKENPKSAYTDEGYDVLVNALVLTKNYERAYQVIESLPELTPTLKEVYQRVTCYHAVEVFNDKRYEEVITLCDKSLKYPISQELAVLTAYVKAEAHYGLKNYTEAIAQYQKFNAGMKPYMEEKLHLSEMRSEYNMAYAYFKQKRFREAKLHFSNALEQSAATKDKDAKSAIIPDLYLRFAECCFITKDYNEALGAYDRVASNNWTGAEYAQYQKGIVQGLQNKFSEKINTLNDLIRKYPNSIYVDQSHYEIGETYLETDNNRDAIEAYNRVVKYYPKSALAPKAFLKTSLALYNLNKKEEALDHYKELIKKYPGSRESQQAIAGIKDLSVELGKPAEYAPFASSEGEKDSLNYQAAELAFLNNDCGRAIILFAHYKDDFPKGIFINEARYYRSECLLRNKQYNDALGEYKSLIENRYTRFYERALLNASGIAFYELKDTAAAYDYYKKLYEASSSTANTYTATLGIMRTSFHQNKLEETMEFADKVIYGEGSKEPDVNDAVYLKAKAAMGLGKMDIAYINFNRAAAAGISARAAESKYRVAQFLYEKGEFKASLDTCFKMKNRFGSYEYWMVKDFILISDNYFALNNAFQAKATLESIIDNYKGDQALIDEAKMKLEKIRTAELNRSKIQLEKPADQLQMDEDTIR